MRLLFTLFFLITTLINLYSVQPERFSNASFNLESNLKYIHDYSTPMFEFKGEIYLTANNRNLGDELFKIDTVENNLDLVIDLYKYDSSEPFILTTLGDKFIFVTNANDKIIPTRFWSTDGTEAGTTMLFEVEETDLNFDLIDNFIIRNKKLYLKTTGVWGAERFWATDGTKEGTKNLTNEFESFHIEKMYLVGDKIVLLESYNSKSKIGVLDTDDNLNILGTFNIGYYTEVWAAEDFFYINLCKENQFYTKELWVSDGTKEGTKKIFTAKDTEICLLDDENAAIFGNSLYFNTKEENGNSVTGWITDGTEQGLVNIEDVGLSSEKVFFIQVINRIKEKVFLIIHRKEAARSLWCVNLEDKKISTLVDNWQSYSYDNSLQVGDLLYFKNKDTNKNFQIWKSDGSQENTELLIDLAKVESKEISTFYFKGSYSDSLLFYTSYFINDVRLFSINLYNNQVEKLTEFDSSSDINVSHVGGVTFFINSIDNRDNLYLSHNKQVEQISLEGAKNETPYLGNYFYSLGNYIYFFADYDGDELFELYRIINPASGISSVEDYEINQVNFYPNPTNNNLTLELEEMTDISIIDINGNQVLSFNDFTGGVIDVSKLATGFYSITNSTGKLLGKFIKAE